VPKTPVWDEEEPSGATFGPLPLLGDQQKHAALVRTCPRMPFPEMASYEAPASGEPTPSGRGPSQVPRHLCRKALPLSPRRSQPYHEAFTGANSLLRQTSQDGTTESSR
jgi:hypothetical protein